MFKTTTVKLDPREVTFLTLQLNITNRLNNALCAGHFALPKMVFDYIMAASWLEQPWYNPVYMFETVLLN